MATKMETATNTAKQVQDQYFLITDQVPSGIWYLGALASIIVSACLFIIGKRDWGTFVGQWPPAFLLFALFHKLLSPSK